MLDGAVKTIPVDESQPVGQMMLSVCNKIGISNYEEYSLVSSFLRRYCNFWKFQFFSKKQRLSLKRINCKSISLLKRSHVLNRKFSGFIYVFLETYNFFSKKLYFLMNITWYWQRIFICLMSIVWNIENVKNLFKKTFWKGEFLKLKIERIVRATFLIKNNCRCAKTRTCRTVDRCAICAKWGNGLSNRRTATKAAWWWVPWAARRSRKWSN